MADAQPDDMPELSEPATEFQRAMMLAARKAAVLMERMSRIRRGRVEIAINGDSVEPYLTNTPVGAITITKLPTYRH